MDSYKIAFAPEQASTFAKEHDAIFTTLVLLTVFFTVAVCGVMFFCIVKYKEKNRRVDRSNPTNHNLPLELAWSIIPLFMAIAVFFWSAKFFVKVRTVPENAMDVYVIGKQWMWHIQHANGVRENNELHIPVGQPIRVTMISQDVIHGLYFPEFRAQYHVLPGRYTTQWFTATKPGKYHMYCSMHCGTQHSEMGGYVYAMPPAEFQQWLSRDGNRFRPVARSMEEEGKLIFEQNACINCHGEKDTLRAPSLLGLYGRSRSLVSGEKVLADEGYIRESILYPHKKIVSGYQNTMPVYSNLSEDQVLKLIAYIKSLTQKVANESLAKTSTTMTTAQKEVEHSSPLSIISD